MHNLSGKEFDLSRIAALLDAVGRPQDQLKIIHVAGTKGKGSTAAFITHILVSAGYRVGLYTSPHLHVINERIRVLDQNAVLNNDDFQGMISDEDLADTLGILRPHIDALIAQGKYLTYFEVLTVAAIYFFSRQHLDWVVLEAGLGGRLDATNAVATNIAVLTSISLDHTGILGNSIPAIALEKAGIIKDIIQKVVIAPQVEEAMMVIHKRCDQFGIKPIVVQVNSNFGVDLPLKGGHQRINAATALQVVKLIADVKQPIADEVIRRGLSQTRWPGRFEILKHDPLIIVDGAHNEDSMRALVQTFKAEYPNRKSTLILGASSDKDIAALIGPLQNLPGVIILTKANHPRAHEFTKEEAGRYFPDREYYLTANIEQALSLALSKSKKDDIIIAAGSLFIAAQIREQMRVSNEI